MRIPQPLLAELITHALADAPYECCGMIASRDGEAVTVFPATNAAQSECRYEIDGFEQWAITSQIDRDGLELGAIYHSHTTEDAYPSLTDIECAGYPGVLHVIVGLAGEEPVVRAFHIRGSSVSETELIVT